jgi:hypothetical protein
MRKVPYAVAVFTLGVCGLILALVDAKHVIAAQEVTARARVVILPGLRSTTEQNGTTTESTRWSMTRRVNSSCNSVVRLQASM